MTDIIHTIAVVPPGHHQTNAGILPNEWTSRPLCSVVEEITETAGTKKIETVSISAGIGFVNQAEKFGKELSGKQYEKYTVLHQGDFSYNKGNSNLYPQGCIYRLNDRAEAAVPNVFESFRVADGNPDYYEQLFVSGFLNKQLYSRINRGVRDDGLLNLRGKDFYSCEVPCPPLAEQDRIAEILIQCDKLLALKQQKINELRKLKKECLKKMFSLKGYDKPEIRFPGFVDAWEQHKLLELLLQPISDGPHETPDLVADGIPFISVEAIVDNRIDFTRKRGYITEKYDLECRKKYSPQKDDVYLVKSGATVGKVAIVETDARFNIWSPIAAMRTNKAVLLPKFLYYYLQLKDVQDEIYAKSIGGTQPNLSMRILEQFTVRLPQVKEQEKIISYFSALDNLIALHQSEMEELKNNKKALGQLLLTGFVRV